MIPGRRRRRRRAGRLECQQRAAGAAHFTLETGAMGLLLARLKPGLPGRKARMRLLTPVA